jgi:hypothetical protein
VTALQDWLSIRPVDPKGIKAFICEALLRLNAGEQAEVQEPPLIRPGIERC